MECSEIIRKLWEGSVMKRRGGLHIMLRLVALIKPLIGYMILAVMMGLIGHLCATFISVFGVYGIASLLDMVDTSLPFIFTCMLVFALLRGILRYGEQACNHFIAFKLLALIRNEVFMALRRLCPAKLEGKDKGDLISIITSDIELLEVFYAHTISPIAIAILFAIVLCISIGVYHPFLGMLALLAYISVGVVIPVVTHKISGEDGLRFRKKSGELSTFVLDSLRGLSEIIQFQNQENRLQKMKEGTRSLSEEEALLKRKSGHNQAVCNMVILCFDVCMLFASSFLYLQELVSFTGVIVSTISLMSSFGPFVALANLGSTLQNTFAAGNRVLDILDEEAVVNEIIDEKEIVFKDAKVEHVHFAYEDEMILEDVSLSIKEGDIVGICGKSGSGKSTLLKLLMRFWKVNEGEILFSGINVENINTTNLRDNESFMTQETHLFQDSIRNNIRIAKLDATDKEIEEACKKASIHDFIMSLPNGYDTSVAELGESLSGGERQRVGVARAFLHNAPLLLLDEPTSNLDSLNEAILLKSLKEEKENKTIVIISHRPSTMRIANCVYSVERGRMS